MDFAEKLTRLMTLAGISNSRLARNMKIDPSLVSRWRAGTRRPANNSDTLLHVATQMAKYLSTDYHRELLAALIGDPALQHADEASRAEAVFAWLSGGHLPSASFPAPDLEAVPGSIPVIGNGFTGAEGKRAALKQMFDVYDPTIPNVTIMFYSNEPIDWIRTDAEYRNALFSQNPNYFDNVSQVKLILNNNASVEELASGFIFIIPFLKKGILRIAQIPRYRKELFSNTILVAGKSVTVVTHGFFGSKNTMTNLYTDPNFIRELSADFNRLLAASEPIHRIEYDITLLDAIEETLKFLLVDQPVLYIGNAFAIHLLPMEELLRVISLTQYYLLSEQEDQGFLQSYLDQFETFLQTQKYFVFLPLYSPEDVENGAVSVSCLADFNGERPVIDCDSYLSILRNILRLCERYPNLIFKAIDELGHDHSTLHQKDTALFAIRNNKPLVFYSSYMPRLVEAFSVFFERKYGSFEKAVQDRDIQIEKLRRHIDAFESEKTINRS